MIPCPSCGAHAVSDDCRCPHCGSKLCVRAPRARTAAALLLGLSIGAAGCPPPIGPEPDYGTSTVTDPPADTDTGDTGVTES